LILPEESSNRSQVQNGYATVYARTDNGRFALGTLSVGKNVNIMCQRIRMKLAADELKGLECVFNAAATKDKSEITPASDKTAFKPINKATWEVLLTGEQYMELAPAQMKALQ
jgi:hypothetical protein